MPPVRTTYGRRAHSVLCELVREGILSTTFNDILVRVEEHIRDEGYVPGPRMHARVIKGLVNAWKGHNIVLDREREIVTITDQGRRRLAIESTPAPLTHEEVSRERQALLRIIRDIQRVVNSDPSTENVGSTATRLSILDISDFAALVPKLNVLIGNLDKHRKRIHDLTQTVLELRQAVGTNDGRNRPSMQEALKQESM